MKDALCFVSDFDFADKLDNNCLEKMVEVRKMLVRVFEDYNMSKMIYALNIIDEIKLSDVNNCLDLRLESTDSLRSVIFYLFSFKHFVDTNNKQEDN